MSSIKEEKISSHKYEGLDDARTHIAYILDLVFMTKRIYSKLDAVSFVEFEPQWKAWYLEIWRRF